ncbi:DUF6074 family protein [Roseinatronobacter alkalisoli]|uniref:DUF6074 family protein n=1 Tax=Roseinatronobacter alkalisoli TaxID=3028235 RepID=A0ABT5TDJ7_9RHOB|nr:DUF6074 family protein [Roseinatronobacter sp. HJB301]MDD7973197.1 DUF6074 family protein [Roseinatronobacter sp. HJB301]
MQRDQHRAAILPLAPSPRSPFVIETARAILHATDEVCMQAAWRAAAHALVDPLIAAGVPDAAVKEHISAFRAALKIALRRMSGGDGGPPGTRQPSPPHRNVEAA